VQLCFQNNYSSTVSIAVMWEDNDDCGGDGGGWATEGWWNLDPGQSTCTDVSTGNRYFYFYAEAEDGEVWSGDYGPVYGTYNAFQGCLLVGNTQDNVIVGMQQVDAGWWHWAYSSFTVNLNG
jgi:hypothetical protein